MPRSKPGAMTLQLSPQAREAVVSRAETYQSKPSYSDPASTMLERYEFLVRAGIRLLKDRGRLNELPVFTAAHFCAAADCLNSTMVTPESLPYVGDEVAEAIEIDGLGEKWELPESAAALFGELRELELLAIADLKERYWRGVTRGDNVTPQEFWEGLGQN